MKSYLFGFLIVAVLLVSVPFVQAETDEERKTRLENELQQVERQILTQRRLVEDKQLERQSLERDLDIIDAEISQAQLGIQARSVAISQLTSQIGDKEAVLIILQDKLEKQKQSLADLIRKISVSDDISLIELMLGSKKFSEFFTEVSSLESIKESLSESLDILNEIKRNTQNQRDDLVSKQENEAELKRIQEIEKREIEKKEAAKQNILKVTKGQEEAYQELLESQQKTAAQLRAQLFELLGGGGAIPFPDAVALARVASGKTGVPTALILAILEQESAYGSNLGSCTMGDVASGKDIMHPDRDKPVFLAIANTLGFNAATQQVSCPLRRSDGSRIGWGGAMGPSQFIPSTWAIYGGFSNTGNGWEYSRYQDAIRSLLGLSVPSNPFNNQDAFVATALLLRDNGANGNYSADRMAALRYYAGWGGATRPENQFYGDGVMNRKSRLEQEIKILGG
ncbi:lytic murein transglycosylase [Candidatus Kaiserbacteria bacterium]|nr:lytic murein transglycosylase [Candidatus Kaiserbacteria bacterium]